MNSVTVSRAIEAPVDAVWAPWEDFGNVYNWHPFVSRSRIVGKDGQKTGVGARRQCDLSDSKNWVREEIIGFEPGRELKVEVYEGTMPLKSALATVRFAALSGNRTRVELRMDFQPKFGVVGRLMAPMMKRQFRSMFTQLLEASEHEARKSTLTSESDVADVVPDSVPLGASS